MIPADAMLQLPWRPGPAWTAGGGVVVVSVTTFEVDRIRDLPGAYLAGLRLRRAWPATTGAVGLRLWARPWQRTSGAISVWRTEADLRTFLSTPEHVAVVHKFRHRASVTSESWLAQRFVAGDIERQARRGLIPKPPR